MNVHMAVALAHIGPPPFDGAIILHKDGDRKNNHVSNLRWGTISENSKDADKHGKLRKGERHPMRKLDEASVRWVKQACGEMTQTGMAGVLGVSISAVNNILRGKTWVHIE